MPEVMGALGVYRRVVAAAIESCRGSSRIQTFEKFATLDAVSDLKVSQIKAILKAADGIEFVLAIHDNKFYVCCYQEEAAYSTEELKSHIQELEERVANRDKLAAALPKGQGGLFA